jgi:hypothetical protein
MTHIYMRYPQLNAGYLSIYIYMYIHIYLYSIIYLYNIIYLYSIILVDLSETKNDGESNSYVMGVPNSDLMGVPWST